MVEEPVKNFKPTGNLVVVGGGVPARVSDFVDDFSDFVQFELLVHRIKVIKSTYSLNMEVYQTPFDRS